MVLYKFLLLTLIAAAVLVSGCTRYTGDVQNTPMDIEIGPRDHPEIPEIVAEQARNISKETNATKKRQEAQTPASAHNLSEKKDATRESQVNVPACEPTVKTCPDGSVSECLNFYLPDKQKCSACEPECRQKVQQKQQEHASETETATVQETRCDIKCGPCQVPDNGTCACVPILFCDGNGICEETDPPGSADCPDCDDADPCTEDRYSFATNECVHLNTCQNSSGTIRITEIFYDAIGSDKGREWIEIENAGPDTDISQWRLLEGGVQHLIKDAGLGTLVKNGEKAIIADNATLFLIEHPLFEGLVLDSSFTLNNKKGDSISLLDGKDGNVADSVTYSDECEAGFSLELKNSAWACSETEGGTPGL